MSHAAGTFEVKTISQPAEDAAGGAAIGRMLLDKQFHGELDAKSVGVMLGAVEQIVTVVPDSGTGQLTGLSGKMTIAIESGIHNCRLDYILP